MADQGYSLISNDGRCPTIASGTRTQLGYIRRRAIAASVRQVYEGGSSGGIDPSDVRVLRADRAAPILAEMRAEAARQAEENLARRALADAGIRAHIEERDESKTIIHNAREVYPLATAAQVDCAFRAILEGRAP